MSALKLSMLSTVCAVLLSTNAWAEDKPILQVLEPPGTAASAPIAAPATPAEPATAAAPAPTAPVAETSPAPATIAAAPAATPTVEAPAVAQPPYYPAPPAPAATSAAPQATPQGAWPQSWYPGAAYNNSMRQQIEDMRSAQRWRQNPQAESRRQWFKAQQEARRAYYQSRRPAPWGGR